MNLAKEPLTRTPAALVAGALVLALAPLSTATANGIVAATPATTDTAATKSCGGLPATIVGTPGDDRVRGTRGRDVIVTLGGDDRVRGHDGSDLICTGGGDDTIVFSGGYTQAGAGNDHVKIQPSRTGTPETLDVYLGHGLDMLEVFTEAVPAHFTWSGGGRQQDFLRTFPYGGGAGDYRLRLGPHGEFAQPYVGNIPSFENYQSGAVGSAQTVVGSRSDNYIDVVGNQSDLSGRGGNDFLRATGLDTSVDGGLGDDACIALTLPMHCER